MNIKNYSFGNITVDNTSFTHDILILPDKTIISWWRKKGHNVSNHDLLNVYKQKPSQIILGTGAYGIMKISDEVIEYCNINKIELIFGKTKKAIDIFNRSENTKKACGLHLTC